MLSRSGGQHDPDRSQVQSGTDPPQPPEVHLLREQIVSERCFAPAGDGGDLQQAIDDAFPGCHLSRNSPPWLVLPEPVSSLSPDLLAALARLIRAAAPRIQVRVIAPAPMNRTQQKAPA